MLTRNREFLLWLTDDEYKLLSDNASRCGLSKQEYMRSVLRSTPVKELPTMDFHEVLKELRHISINVNQIAMRANKMDFIDVKPYRENMEALKTAIGELMKAVYG